MSGTLIQDAREAVYQRVRSLWPGTGGTPFVFDNEAPEGNVDLDAGSVPWVRFSYVEISGGQETLGPPGIRKYNRRGVIFAGIFVPVNTGKRRSGELVSAVRALFEGVRFSGLFTDDADAPRELGPGPEGRWDQTFMSVNCQSEEQK